MAKKRVLICDDNQELLELLSLELELTIPVEVVSMYNGKSCLDYLRKIARLPDLMIIDLMLPDLEGDDVIQMLRKDNRFENLPIILISGVIVNIDKRAKAVGANDYLVKPFSINVFKEKVKELLII